ncbi:MAG: hypothetical protein PVJ60_09175 [Phycisphaerales bacterium]
MRTESRNVICELDGRTEWIKIDSIDGLKPILHLDTHCFGLEQERQEN